ncbi:hypothetical protein LMJ41_20665 [Streptomyces globisporus]|nr:hypothetical protein [Streptomyces globisporus]
MRPGQGEGQIVLDLRPDVLDDQRVHQPGSPGSELVGVDTAEGVSEHDRAADPQMLQHGGGILDVPGRE